MSLGCKCDAGLSNTGKPNCVTLQSVTSKMVMVQLTDSTGVKNSVDLGSLPVWNDLVNEVDASKRWFPLPIFENVELPKADSIFEEAPSGRKQFIRQGKRSFAGELWSETPQLLGKINDNRCVEFGVYMIDVNGNLIGSKEGSKLYPIPVDNQSFEARLMFSTDTTTQKIMVSFDFYRLFDESSLWLITPEESSVDFNELEGLLDVNFTEVSHSVSTLIAKLTLDYGTAVNPLQVKGLVLANFSAVDSTGASVSVSAVTSVANEYTITFATQIVGTILTIKAKKDGYVGEYTFTI